MSRDYVESSQPKNPQISGLIEHFPSNDLYVGMCYRGRGWGRGGGRGFCVIIDILCFFLALIFSSGQTSTPNYSITSSLGTRLDRYGVLDKV